MTKNAGLNPSVRAVQRFLILAGAVLLTSPVFAHALLEHATPPAGAELTAAPLSVSLRYSEAVEPLFSAVTVTDSKGDRMDEGKPVAQDDRRVLVVALKKLTPGVYSVDWHVTSVDTHKTSGHFIFAVKP